VVATKMIVCLIPGHSLSSLNLTNMTFTSVVEKLGATKCDKIK
jgi:hypothetical protein